MEKEYKYDAFISYRHFELDKFVAERLHKILETYELPKNIKKKLNIEGRTIKRIFRDQEELPLSSNLEDPILDALKDSKYLIVICSPRLKDSLWCKKEIETFKELRGRKNIFCVLVEGEPKDSFPEEVLYDGKKLVEPLAADVRGNSKKEVLKKIKSEKLRLVAPMYNLDYDDLKQRHKLRKQKRVLTTSIIVAISCFLFTLYTSLMLIKINKQQKTLKLHQALSLSQKSESYLKKDNRYDAIKSSYQALTKFKGVKMPYTSDAEYALTESLGVYDVGSSYKAVKEIKTEGVASIIKSSYDNKYAAVYDESEHLTLFNTKTLEIIDKYTVSSSDINTFTFIGNNIFSYIDEEGSIKLINIKNNKLIKEIKDKKSFSSVKGEKSGKYLIYNNQKTLYIYNIKDNKQIGKISTKDKYLKEMCFSEDSNYIFAYTEEDSFELDQNLTIHVIKTSNSKEINDKTFDASYIEGLLTIDDNAYILLNNTKGTDYNMLVVSYNYINNDINWTKTSDNSWGSIIKRSYPEDSNDIAIVHYDTLNVLNRDNGDIIESFNTSSKIINMYSYLNKEIYLLFTSDGSVNYINMEYKNNVEYMGKYEFNIDEYTSVTQSKNGYLLIPKNENRVILYEAKSNKDIKEENIKIDTTIKDSISISDYDKLKKQYNIKNKSLVDKMFYDNKKELLFVNYTNKDISIYNTKNKKLIKTLTNVGKVDRYFGKDKNNRIYIGDISNSYILDSDYNKVGHIKSLRKLEKDKVIIANNDKYYSVKIYSLDDMLKEAKKYLN